MEALGGRGKRRRNIVQKHGGAKHGLGVKVFNRSFRFTHIGFSQPEGREGSTIDQYTLF